MLKLESLVFTWDKSLPTSTIKDYQKLKRFIWENMNEGSALSDEEHRILVNIREAQINEWEADQKGNKPKSDDNFRAQILLMEQDPNVKEEELRNFLIRGFTEKYLVFDDFKTFWDRVADRKVNFALKEAFSLAGKYYDQQIKNATKTEDKVKLSKDKVDLFDSIKKQAFDNKWDETEIMKATQNALDDRKRGAIQSFFGETLGIGKSVSEYYQYLEEEGRLFGVEEKAVKERLDPLVKAYKEEFGKDPMGTWAVNNKQDVILKDESGTQYMMVHNKLRKWDEVKKKWVKVK